MAQDEVAPDDLINTLSRIADRARKTQDALARGTAVNGKHGLMQIEHEARDALLRAGGTDGDS